ncbi:LPS assembly lipoprotein LptE [uncultured Cocleimonas sp.]|uniref:LPS-assembly lipoprotein LptE n=1 Tax=uncultured Cocleimonas sp. TaxID=1051587 RepID=UPI00262CDACC|nr:LPS assembly lipoprotein LptE [uncultured Cocleimonas sp.]
MNTSFAKASSDFFSRKKRVAFFVLLGSSVLLASMLQGCSGNGFHLRNSVDLPPQYQTIALENLPVDSGFRDIFEEALENAGGRLIAEDENSSAAKSIIRLKDYKQDKRVVAYTSERKVREYLLYLKFNYEVVILEGKTADRKTADGKKNKEKKLPIRRINIDKSYLYDPDYALGKAEEEKLVKNKLYQEASRLILLRLQYSK